MQAVGLVRSSSPDPQSSTFSGNQEADLGVFETGTTPPVLETRRGRWMDYLYREDFNRTQRFKFQMQVTVERTNSKSSKIKVIV